MFNSLGKCRSVKTTEDNTKSNNIDIIYNRYSAYESITIEFENNTLKLKAYGDCCSHSWFEEFPDQSFQLLVGKTIIDLNHKTKTIDMPVSQIQEVDRNHVHEFEFDDGTVFEFLLRNSSNGYYDGYISSKWKYNTHIDTEIPSTAQLIVIIGMPGCGKTTYVKNHYTPLKVFDSDDNNWGIHEARLDNTTYHFFDDYLIDPTKVHTHIMPLLLKGCRVIVADPRLCDKNVFQREIIETFTSYIRYKFVDKTERPSTPHLLNIKKQLVIVKFNNNTYQSILNVIRREQGDDKEEDAIDYIKSIVKIHDNYKTQFNRYDYSIEFGLNVFQWITVDTWIDQKEK